VVAQYVEAGPAGRKVVEAVCRVSHGVAISCVSVAGLLVHLSCQWEGTDRWAEVEPREMACVGRT
jgi:hypothetical protein